MRSIVFAKRNLKEIVRDPLSLIFNVGFPVLLLLVFKILTSGMGEEAIAATPQFAIERLAPSIAMFSFSFITLFSGMLVSKDRTSSFLTRLRTSPIKPSEFFLGYTLPLIPIAIIQTILVYLLSMILGLSIDIYVLLSILILIPISILFITLGVLLGCIFNDRAVGGVASILINFVVLFSGMFFPLETMNKTVKTIAYIFPFANSLKITNCVINNDYTDFWGSFAIVMGYIILITIISIVVFSKKIKSDKV